MYRPHERYEAPGICHGPDQGRRADAEADWRAEAGVAGCRNGLDAAELPGHVQRQDPGDSSSDCGRPAMPANGREGINLTTEEAAPLAAGERSEHGRALLPAEPMDGADRQRVAAWGSDERVSGGVKAIGPEELGNWAFDLLPDDDVEEALQRAANRPPRPLPRRSPPPTDDEIRAELAARPLNATLPWNRRRDAVTELTAMLDAAEKRLSRLQKSDALRSEVEDATLWVEALRRELALAEAGKLPSILDDLVR